MDPVRNSAQRPAATTAPPMPPYPQDFPPPPVTAGAGQAQPTSLGGMGFSSGPALSQEFPPNVPTVNVIQPTPIPSSSSQSTTDGPPPNVAELPAYPMEEAQAPSLPQRPSKADTAEILAPPPTVPVPPSRGNPKAFANTPSAAGFAPPPQRQRSNFSDDDPSNPIHYTRDPHKLVAYLVPFPIPHLTNAPSSAIPFRFLVYTPPPPPLHKPPPDEKEGLVHKVQRKWQSEVRNAKTSTAETASWQGVRSKFTRGVDKAMSYTTSSNLDFLGRVSPSHSKPSSRSPSPSPNPNDSAATTTTPAPLSISEMVLIYPPSLNQTPGQMRQEFVNTMLRTKSKATRDSIISTGLLPISFGIDILAGPIGGLGEINTVWAYSNIRGAKTARSVTKRLALPSTSTSADPSSTTGEPELNPEAPSKDKLQLSFTPSPRIEILRAYLNAECHKVDSRRFPGYKSPPTESDVLDAIGWSPHQSGGETLNWEDEAWETAEVKDDLKVVMHKAAKEWCGWCREYEKNPEKGIKK